MLAKNMFSVRSGVTPTRPKGGGNTGPLPKKPNFWVKEYWRPHVSLPKGPLRMSFQNPPVICRTFWTLPEHTVDTRKDIDDGRHSRGHPAESRLRLLN
jgi:hypothetical protein